MRPALFLLCLSAGSLVACGFFPEATFYLSPDSRLPRWFEVPDGMSRRDRTVTIGRSRQPCAMFGIREYPKSDWSIIGPIPHEIVRAGDTYTSSPQGTDEELRKAGLRYPQRGLTASLMARAGSSLSGYSQRYRFPSCTWRTPTISM